MKILRIILTFQLLLGFSCFCFACIGPVNTSKVCNRITNLKEFSDNYYAVIACHGHGCDSEGGHYIIKFGNDCIKGGGRIYLIPNNIPYNTLNFDLNTVHIAEGNEIIIGYLDDLNRNCDGSDADEETNIYKIVQDETGIRMELINKYKGYDVKEEVGERGELGKVGEMKEEGKKPGKGLNQYILYEIGAIGLCIILVGIYYVVNIRTKSKK